MQVLKQKKIFVEKKFILEENGIRIFEKGIMKQTEDFIEYELLNLEKKYVEKKVSWTLISLSVIVLFYFVLFCSHLIKSGSVSTGDLLLLFPLSVVTLSIVAWTISEVKNNTYLFSYDNSLIEFFTDRPNKDEFEAFLASLKDKKRGIRKINYLMN